MLLMTNVIILFQTACLGDAYGLISKAHNVIPCMRVKAECEIGCVSKAMHWQGPTHCAGQIFHLPRPIVLFPLQDAPFLIFAVSNLLNGLLGAAKLDAALWLQCMPSAAAL